MKKLLSLALVVMMVLSLCVTAFAADDGSITITNATVGQTYTIYKVFDASIKTTADGTAVAYSINPEENEELFTALFGADGKTENQFFTYNPNTNEVAKKQGANDSELIKYLNGIIVKDENNDGVNEGPVAASGSKTATVEEVNGDGVVFADLAYGYYLITSSLGATVTINSNTPDVEVIDKNQEPGNEFNKQVYVGQDEDGNDIWADSNSASIGDEITYKISFEATNYDGDKLIKYYQIHDEKGDAIWAEFNSFDVWVGDTQLKRGYYLSQGGVNTDNWEFLGDWSDIPEADRDRDDAQWYLVHLGEDKFRITIPWLTGHSITDNVDGEGNVTSYNVLFAENATSKYDSPANVVVTYNAVVEANASIGSTTHGNRFNKANASWTSENETGSTPPDEVVTNVYGIGLLKDDSDTGVNLAGAKFRIYKDKDCTEPVYVIPTGIDGVYILDSFNTPLAEVSGTLKKTTRDLYAAYLADYLGTNTQDNYVVSQANGKLAILGLEAGKYYLKEVEAPAGYNSLTLPVEIEAGVGTRPFYIFADDDGNVADIQTTDGVYKEHIYDLTHTVVHNSKGLVLPSTGGKGTAMLITLGSVVAIGFAVFLITHKKMSAYVD